MSSAAANPRREQLSGDVARLNMKPLWERVMRLAPGTVAAPVIWRWQQVQPHLMRSAEVITTREAERRVLMLENPALKGSTFATTTLYAGLQVILPGEIARTHRHAPNALRLIVEGTGAYTAVEGERVMMQPGDFVTTPNWAWHDHGNLGSGPVVWLDGLDTAFANLFGAHFREDYPQESQPVSRLEGDSGARFGANLLPVDHRPGGHASPLLTYPYERAREALERLAKGGDPHPSLGHKLRYVNPATGGHVFPTMAVYMQWLPKGFDGRRYRGTDGAVFC
ncbi:MAG TPA: cupin domain-containing protein, partial [Burkholderiales bacterium]|nr:cupin domain-containing protein [Burkholderiales bacterium]